MLPKTLALIEDDPEFAEFLSKYLVGRAVQVEVFGDSNDLLAHADSYDYDFYLIDLRLPGIDGVDLIKVIRRRSDAGVLVVSGRADDEVFNESIGAGADMVLAKPVQFEQVAVAIEAIQRRVVKSVSPQTEWRLDRRARQLEAPDGARTELSEMDLAIIECFVAAGGDVVSRDTLREAMNRVSGGSTTDVLNATIYRLRRRIERVTPSLVPLQSKSRVGYVFRAPLTVV